ncbi:MAG: cysteine--tRNA ligase [Anaerolineaceae bacterium]|nr:cysteine--tRNA ligase [Anaerolineaceae bacterium]
MAIKIFNTLTRKKEDFVTIEPGKVRMYVCGVTVYNKAHVGHAMSALVFDILRRYLEYRGYEVKHVTNFTDVDDKIINRAAQLGKDPFELAEGYILELKRNFQDLNVLPATVYPRATLEMDTIIRMIEGLIEKGYAYPADGDVYFRVQKDADYGKLSGRKIEDMKSGTRVEVGEIKDDPLDFALWKGAKPGEPAWKSPWGSGRPGWHIECSAMNLTHLGEQIDIHGGGNDLVFPHHENEIAQSECFTGKLFSRYWVHNGMLVFSGEKMSKSLGNVITIDDFLSKHSADVLRFLVLNSGYRSPLTFTDEVIEQAERGLERLHSALKPALPGVKGAPEAGLKVLADQMDKTRKGFEEAMDDDFNTSGAMAALFELVKNINQTRADSATAEQLADAQNMLRELGGVLGLRLEEKTSGGGAADAYVNLLLEVRAEIRKQKLWALSDLIRDRLAELGVTLQDSKEGSSWHWS